jgi:hypothetical protein
MNSLLWQEPDMAKTKHPELQWNPESKEWFCIRCFKTSDHVSRQDAEVELSQFDCIAANGPKPSDQDVQ